MALITDCLKSGEFRWSKGATKAFEEIKQKMVETHILRVLNFSKVFEVACDASGIGIGGVLSQEDHPIACFSEKLNATKLRYSTYVQEFYAPIQALCHWRHYLLLQDFVIFWDHKSLKCINSQKKLNGRHVRWVEFL